MHELLTTASGWWLNHAQDSLLRYLTHSAVTLAMVGTVAWLGDRLLRSVGPQAQHRMWVTALLMSVALPLLPAGWLARLGPAPTSVGLGTVTVTYNTVAAAAERWTVSPMLDVPHQEMDVERFIASLPGLAAGRQTLFGELARLAKPETELTVSEHADRYRVVSPESGSPFPGPWRTDRVPYLREPMDCLHPDHPARRVTRGISTRLLRWTLTCSPRLSIHANCPASRS